MAYLTAEQIMAAQRSNLETLLGLTQKAFEGVEKLVELNLQVARASMDEAASNARSAMSVKDAQDLLNLQASLLQPAAEKAASYSKHVYDIAQSTGAEISKVAESQMADMQQKMMGMVDAMAKNAPAGSENATALVKTAVAAANNAFESVHRAAKQAADVAEANFQAMSNSAVSAAKTASTTTKARR